MNRQTRRHPTHPALPIQYPSKEKVQVQKEKKPKAANTKKGYKPQKDKV